MNGVGATTMRRTTMKPLKRRISGAVMTALAVLITIWPVFITGLWMYNTFIYEPRKVVALSALPQPAEVRLFEEPLVSVTFDDGWESVYSQGAPILEKYGTAPTLYSLTGVFDDPQYLSKQQILSMQRAGYDIQVQTVEHKDLKKLNDAQLEYELQTAKTDMSKLLGREVTAFAAPYSSYDTRVITRIKAYYGSQRNTNADISKVGDEDVNVQANFDPYNIMALAVRSTTRVEDVEAFLDYAKQRKAWAVLSYHEVSTTSQSIYSVTPHQLEDQLAAIKKRGIKTATVSQVMDDYNSRLQRGE